MGIRISKNNLINTLRLDDYEAVAPRRLSNQPIDYRILKNRLTGNQMEEYTLQFGDSTQYHDYYDAYYWRLSQDHVVRTLHFIDCTKAEFCSTVYAARLYTERIPLKLSDIKDIPYPDNLYVLLASLDGFDRIVQKAGYFEIQQHMICINRQGQVKVWINDNLSRNYPDNDNSVRVNTEEQMVKRLISIIQNNTDKASQPSSLSDYIFSQVHNPSFGDAMLLVREFSKENRTDIPTNFQCILQVLNDSSYPSQQSRSQQSISNNSHIKSSMPGNIGSNLMPTFGPGLVTAQVDPRIAQLSQISQQIPQNSRFNVFQQSILKSQPIFPQQHITQFSRIQPTPIIISPRQHFLAHHQQIPPQHQLRNVLSQKIIPSPQTIVNPSYHQARSLQKTPIYKNVQFPVVNFKQQSKLPPPLNIRQFTRIQYENQNNKSSKQQMQKIKQQVNKKQYEVRQRKQIRQQQIAKVRKFSGVNPVQRSLSPNRDITSQFINPFDQQQVQPQHEYISNPYPQLIVNTRESNILHIQTPQDIRNEQLIEEIKRNKAQIFKETKQMVNKIKRQVQSNTQYSAQYQYQTTSYQNSKSAFSQKQSTHNSNLYQNYKHVYQPQVSFQKQKSFQNQRNILIYHSINDYHHIDPEIARDLMALVE